ADLVRERARVHAHGPLDAAEHAGAGAHELLGQGRRLAQIVRPLACGAAEEAARLSAGSVEKGRQGAARSQLAPPHIGQTVGRFAAAATPYPQPAHRWSERSFPSGDANSAKIPCP